MAGDDLDAGEPITEGDLEDACLADLIAAGGSAPTEWVASDFERGEVAKSLNALASKGYIEVDWTRTTIMPQGAAFLQHALGCAKMPTISDRQAPRRQGRHDRAPLDPLRGREVTAARQMMRARAATAARVRALRSGGVRTGAGFSRLPVPSP